MPKDHAIDATTKSQGAVGKARFQSEQSSGSEALSIFIAAPMSGFDNDADFQAAKSDIALLSNTLRGMRKVEHVYFAGENIASTDNFSPNNNALISDITMLAKSDHFIFIYPKKVLTSALVEVGYALGRGIRSHFFVKDRSDLPYLLKDCHEVCKTFDQIPEISVSSYSNGEDLARKARDRLYNL